VSLIADAVGIATYLGFEGDHTVRIILGSALTLIALAAGMATAISAGRAWLGPRGAFRPTSFHRNNFFAASIALALAAFLGVATAHVIAKSAKGGTSHGSRGTISKTQ
jgi:hypothetical protein